MQIERVDLHFPGLSFAYIYFILYQITVYHKSVILLLELELPLLLCTYQLLLRHSSNQAILDTAGERQDGIDACREGNLEFIYYPRNNRQSSIIARGFPGQLLGPGIFITGLVPFKEL